MKTPRIITWMAALAASSLILTGCSAGASDSGDESKKDSMAIAFTAEPVNLDFTSTSGIAIPEALMENVYESLVRVDGEGEIQPGLAEDWDVSDDRKTYTFHLQKGVKFSNGADLTSEDVKFSYERVQNDWKNALKSKMDIVDSIKTPDDLTVEIALKKPSNTWLFNLTSLVGAVFDTEGTDDLANEAIGTGPFAIEKFTRGQSIDFTARDDYWGETPGVKNVQFKYFQDAVSASNALKSGEIDVVSNLQAPELAGEFQSSDYQIISGTTNGEVVLSMNNAKGIFKDKKAREAVMHAVDRKAVLDTAWAGYGELIGSMVPPTDPYYEDLTGSLGLRSAEGQRSRQRSRYRGGDVRLHRAEPAVREGHLRNRVRTVGRGRAQSRYRNSGIPRSLVGQDLHRTQVRHVGHQPCRTPGHPHRLLQRLLHRLRRLEDQEDRRESRYRHGRGIRLRDEDDREDDHRRRSLGLPVPLPEPRHREIRPRRNPSQQGQRRIPDRGSELELKYRLP